MPTKKEIPTPPVHPGDCLSWGDSFFLYLEREGQPLSIAAISEFEGQITARDCARFIESKLHLIPRYRQRVVFPPFNVGLPVWEFDPNFDTRNHVRETRLKHGTDEEFKAAVGKVLSTILDRSRPLWDFTIFRGLKGNRTGILARVHHCLADGIAGVRLMHVLMDTAPHTEPLPKAEPFDVPSPRDSGSLLLDGLFRSYFSVVERLLNMQAELFQAAQNLLVLQGGPPSEPTNGTSRSNLPAKLETLKELACLTDRLPFNRVCWGPHNIAWTELPLHEIKKVKNIFGTTVNNVLLTVLTSAIRRYSEAHGVELKGRQMRVVVPVNVRGDDNPDHLGNRITFLPINVPLDIVEERDLLLAIHERMEAYKATKVAAMVGLLGNLIGVLPTTFQAMAAPILSELPLNLVNTIITNIPGPQAPLYVMGHKMTRWYPVVPIGGEMGMNIALLSYNGNVYFGFHGDVQAVPDIEAMETLVQSSFANLLRATDTGRGRKQRAKTASSNSRRPRPPKLSGSTPQKSKVSSASKGAPARKSSRKRVSGNPAAAKSASEPLQKAIETALPGVA
jgi:diacylglycerol O-acyltransferase